MMHFWHFYWYRGFCHRTESDLFLFLLLPIQKGTKTFELDGYTLKTWQIWDVLLQSVHNRVRLSGVVREQCFAYSPFPPSRMYRKLWYEQRKSMFRVTFSSSSSCIIINSPHVRITLFCILFHSRDRRECFKQLKIFLSVPRMEKNTEYCDTNLRGMDNNARRTQGDCYPKHCFFSIRISLFSTFATMETGHNSKCRSFVSYRTRFISSFSYIIYKVQTERFATQLCNFILRNYIQLFIFIRSIVLSLHTWKILTFLLFLLHRKIVVKISLLFRCTET